MKTTVVFYRNIFLMRTFNVRIRLEVERGEDFVDNCVHLRTVCGRLACERDWEKVLLGTDLRIHIKTQHGEEQLNIG